MRMSREVMAHHHEEIVRAASRMLRERGIEGTSVAELMQAVGLTHGGFYRHFESKDALVAEAAEAAFAEKLHGLKKSSKKRGSVDAVKDYADQYLSQRHVAKRDSGCPMAALGADVAREDLAVRDVFADGAQQMLAELSAGLNGGPAERREKAMRLLAMLVGALVIARAVGDQRLGNEILSACRQPQESARRSKG